MVCGKQALPATVGIINQHSHFLPGSPSEILMDFLQWYLPTCIHIHTHTQACQCITPLYIITYNNNNAPREREEVETEIPFSSASV